MSHTVLRRRLLGIVLLVALAGPAQEPLAGDRALVTLGPIQASAPFSPAWISQMLEPMLPAFERCWLAAAARGERGGYLELRMDVAAVPVRYRKVPPRITVEGSSLSDPAVVSCVTGVARSLLFAASERDATIRVRLNFEASGAAPAPVAAAPVAPAPQVAWVQGKLLDAANDQPISGGTVLILRPNVKSSTLDATQLARQVMTMAVSSSRGDFKVSVPPPRRGAGYGIAVIAGGYEPVATDGAVKGAGTNNLGIIRLQRRRF